MLIDGINDFVQLLRGDEKDDLAQMYLHQLDLPPFGMQPPSVSDKANTPMVFGRSFVGAKIISLPQPETSLCQLDLTQSLFRRNSDLNCSGEEISLAEFSTLLGLAMGTVEQRKTRGSVPGRTYPSGGGLYPIEAYVMVKHVSELREGIYHYSPALHHLESISFAPLQLSSSFFDERVQPDLQPGWLDNIGFSLILTSAMAKNYYKYGDRAWKLALLEAGHIGQNVYLIAASMKRLNVCALGGFKQPGLVRALKIDGYAELPIYPLHIGVRLQTERQNGSSK